MTQVQCSNCRTVFTVPKGQREPTKCGICGRRGTLSMRVKTWACQGCGCANGIDKTACQGCRVERVTRSADPGGRRVPPADDHRKLPRRQRVKIVKSIVSDGD